MNLKIGDKVFLKDTSRYVGTTSCNTKKSANPLGVEGIIYDINDSKYRVKWDNGEINNGYTDDDLELVVPKSKIDIVATKIEEKQVEVSTKKRRLLIG